MSGNEEVFSTDDGCDTNSTGDVGPDAPRQKRQLEATALGKTVERSTD